MAIVQGPTRDEQADAQRRSGLDLWTTRELVAAHADRELRPAEAMLLARHREALAGRVLELGCGAGRLTGYLCDLGATVLGVDISPLMVGFCRRKYSAAAFEVGDLRLAKALGARGRFDAVIVGNGLVDVLDHEERERVLGDIGELLTNAGIFYFSSRNLAFAPRIAGPFAALRGGSPVDTLRRLVRVPLWLYNRRRMRRREIRTADYAMLNDRRHDFRRLHHYITRDAEELELARVGLTLVECLDEAGHRVMRGESAPECAELHYVARRATSR